MADTYRDTRDPYNHGYNYYHYPHHQQSYSHMPATPDYLGTPPSQPAALTSYSHYAIPPSPQHSSSGSSDYWYHSYHQFPPTPTSPHSPYSPFTSSPSYSPSSPHFSPYSSSNSSGSPRSAMPAIPDYLNSHETRANLLLRSPYEMRQRIRKRRASASAIADLKILRLKDLPEDDRCCNICMEPYVEEKYPCDQPKKENATRMPCGHVFGSYCLKQWLQNHNTCPACRMEVDYVEVEEEIVPRSRAERRPSLSTHELIVNDLFGEPYRDPAPPRSKTPHQTSRSRPYFGSYEPERRPGTASPATNRPALKRTQTSMGGGTVRYPFARPLSEDYSNYESPSPPRTQSMREQPYGRPSSSSSSTAATTQSEPSHGSDGYYSHPGLPSTRPSNGRATPFRRAEAPCALRKVKLCVMEDEDYGQSRLIKLECGHAFHVDCLYSSMKARGDTADLGARLLWCERCRKYLGRRIE
ncbi:hypothetical protein BDZ91DRAFT_58904 [Kalaharituber pfeilii]|nr:hypothetical protein BDZ91DRAFT_58904 [Kalaharituber pfeilii]